MRLHIDQSPGPRDRRVIRGLLIQADPQKLPEGQRVGGPPRDALFGVDSLEIANQQQAEIGSRRQRRPPIVFGIELGTLVLGKLIELLLVQQFVKPLFVARILVYIYTKRRRPRWLRFHDLRHSAITELAERDTTT